MDDVTLTTKLCEIVGALPGFAWRPAGPAYGAAELGVFYGSIGSAPDRAVGVRIYGSNDERYLAQRRVQIRVRGGRGARTDADAIAGVIFSRLNSLSQEGGISGISRISMTPLGADQNGREERTENYLITLDNEEALS